MKKVIQLLILLVLSLQNGFSQSTSMFHFRFNTWLNARYEGVNTKLGKRISRLAYQDEYNSQYGKSKFMNKFDTMSGVLYLNQENKTALAEVANWEQSWKSFAIVTLCNDKALCIYNIMEGTWFATHTFDYERPVEVIQTINKFLEKEGASRYDIVQITLDLVKYFISCNEHGLGGGYYESPDYTPFDLAEKASNSRLYEKVVEFFPDCREYDIPNLISVVSDFSQHISYATERLCDQDFLVALYRILSTDN